mgnify:FL=1
MEKIQSFQITGMTIAGFKSYEEPTSLVFGNPTVITGGNGRGKTSIADAIAFAVTGLPFFGERGIDRLHNETQPDVSITMRFVDETDCAHVLTRTRHKNRMTILYDGYEIRQMDLTDLFGEKDVFLSIFNPLYFIEELGDEGKNLLERHLPLISHEAVLAQLSDATRAALEGENILSPETYLKKTREDIRNLEETIIYLQGQKDLAESQGENWSQTVEGLTARRDALNRTAEALEAKRFDGLDTKAMEQQLVELSARYDEAARDGSPLDAEILELERKLTARKAEQYQSPYAQSIAEASARLTELAARFNRDKQAFHACVPGAPCPTCRRLITEEAMAEVRTALEQSSRETITAGQEQRAQLNELNENDAKAKAVFEQFQADDVAKLEGQLSGLKAKKSEDSPMDDLRTQIQQLTADLEYGNLSEAEYAQLKECREELRECAAELKAAQAAAVQKPEDIDGKIGAAQEKIKTLKKLIADVAIYVSERAKLTFSALKMNRVEISLYDIVKTTGERKDVFKFTYGGRRYDRLSLSEKIRAGMEVSELMKRLTGRNYPVFVDNMESVDDLANVRPTGQVIMAKCVSGTPLAVRPVKPIAVVEQQAA